MSIGVSELLLILVIVFVLFGAGKLPQVMNDIGKGIKGLKKGLRDKDENSDEKEVLKKPENIEQKNHQ